MTREEFLNLSELINSLEKKESITLEAYKAIMDKLLRMYRESNKVPAIFKPYSPYDTVTVTSRWE